VPYAASAWSWADFDAHVAAAAEPCDWAIALRDLCVVDVDDHSTAEALEARFPALRAAPCERTKRGKHYFFLRSALCEEGSFFDGCGKVTQGIDFKSVCSTGTSGIIVIAPSTDKSWERAPWETALDPIPDDLLVYVARPAGVPPPRAALEGGAPLAAAPSPLPPMATDERVRLSFDGGGGGGDEEFDVSRLRDMSFFGPLLGGRWPASRVFAVPASHDTFALLLTVLETGDSPLGTVATPELLVALEGAADVLGVAPARRASGRVPGANRLTCARSARRLR
jgi:hypothetical protein